MFWADAVYHVLVNEFIVQFRTAPGPDQSAALGEAGAIILESYERLPGRYTVTFPDVDDELGALTQSNALHQHRDVEFSQPNFLRILSPPPSPRQREQSTPLLSCSGNTEQNDPLYPCQWALPTIEAAGAWEVLATEDVKHWPTIAVLDDGIDMNHEDLAPKIVAPYDAISHDDDPTPPLHDAHGTACAGIAGAVANNAMGIAGVAAGAKIMPIRIITTSYMTGVPWMDARTITRGLLAAVDRGAHVLSGSWVYYGNPDETLNAPINYAIARGRTVVFAAGNDQGSVGYPANLSTSGPVIAVGATNERDQLSVISNYGHALSVVAPGVGLLTTAISGTGEQDAHYTTMRPGTSSATALVAGVAALMLAANPTLSPSEVKTIIQSTADDLGAPGFDDLYGHGRLNAKRAVVAAVEAGAGRP